MHFSFLKSPIFDTNTQPKLQRLCHDRAIRSGQTVQAGQTVKPLDIESLLEHCSNTPVIVSVEEHTVLGGLGSAVAEVIAEANFEQPKRFRRIGIPDVFPDQYGTQDSLMERYSITTTNVINVVKGLADGQLQPAFAAKR